MTRAQCRQTLIGIRAAISDRDQKNRRIFDKLKSLLAHEEILLSYVGVKDEVPTLEFLDWWLSLGKVLYAPRCASGGMMNFFEVHGLADLHPAPFGLLEPGPDCPAAKGVAGLPCLVPGLGFTRKGARIGYGKGYYDRFLRENRVKSIGVCYNEQIRDFLPVDSWDEKVLRLVTDQFIQEALDVQ